MDKFRQQQLLSWLKKQRIYGNFWFRLSLLIGMVGALLIVYQAWLLATLLQGLIVDHLSRDALLPQFILLLSCFVLRGVLLWLRELAGFASGRAIREKLRRDILDKLTKAGPAVIQGQAVGSWTTLLLEQIDNLQDYYARYLPQTLLAALIPCLLLAVLFPVNWVAALILLLTAPLIPLFMALAGMGAADANRRNFQALARLGGYFLDRLQGMETLRLFNQADAETDRIRTASASFRQRTMEVLRLAFLSSAVLEFFAAVSVAVVAVYFGFSYLGELNFGHYGTGITLFAGFLSLILAPEFFQPLRELGTFYHAKAQATGAADALEKFLTAELLQASSGTLTPNVEQGMTLTAADLRIMTHEGIELVGPLNFTLSAGKRVALIGRSGAGKTSLLNVLAGYLPYQGSLKINDTELRDILPSWWQQQLAWVGQNPHLPAQTVRENIVAHGEGDPLRLQQVCELAGVDEFLARLPEGLESAVGEQAAALSVGQAQRIAVARALYKPCRLLLLDEPDASLDGPAGEHVNRALLAASFNQTTLFITHRLDRLAEWDEVWLLQAGEIVQQGSKAQLLQRPGPFKALVEEAQA
ncbi:cysteine/glutathione ABC transporter permease/ATP-binding protein CydD [Erwinia sp. BC051422]|uniref:heme ABC transporter permease/ATP-binding protein CydD n=1 Tax=Erwinia wuhanensis TaxID=3045167 RepID=UPI00264FB492|nr:cysteine/glutathione ABC transporter permease/ATP-binding protein CydD [Erwinia sp. BC051422]MDN8540880.1 cysteine/glutathione ABC transporter permease/ATP-binding protein CydD [Erwinia sp. BC051422]